MSTGARMAVAVNCTASSNPLVPLHLGPRGSPGREGDLRTVLLIGATADPFEGDSVEIERALTDLGVRNGGARPS